MADEREIWHNPTAATPGYTWGGPDGLCAGRTFSTYKAAMRDRGAFFQGLADGEENPYELSMGMTYDDPDLNETYDQGVNEGQRRARARLFEEADDPATVFDLASDFCGWDLEGQRNRLFAYIREHTRDQASLHCFRRWLQARAEEEIREAG